MPHTSRSVRTAIRAYNRPLLSSLRHYSVAEALRHITTGIADIATVIRHLLASFQ